MTIWKQSIIIVIIIVIIIMTIRSGIIYKIINFIIYEILKCTNKNSIVSVEK
jgi:hypothetical protein